MAGLACEAEKTNSLRIVFGIVGAHRADITAGFGHHGVIRALGVRFKDGGVAIVVALLALLAGAVSFVVYVWCAVDPLLRQDLLFETKSNKRTSEVC